MLSLKTNRVNIYITTTQVKKYSYDIFSHLMNAHWAPTLYPKVRDVYNDWEIIGFRKTTHHHLLRKKEADT